MLALRQRRARSAPTLSGQVVEHGLQVPVGRGFVRQTEARQQPDFAAGVEPASLWRDVPAAFHLSTQVRLRDTFSRRSPPAGRFGQRTRRGYSQIGGNETDDLKIPSHNDPLVKIALHKPASAQSHFPSLLRIQGQELEHFLRQVL